MAVCLLQIRATPRTVGGSAALLSVLCSHWFYGGPPSGELEAPPLGFRDRSTILPCRVQPKIDSFVAIGQCSIRGIAVRGAAGQLRNFRHEDLVVLTPINDDLVFVHLLLAPEAMARDHRSYLPNLIRFGLAARPLQID